MKKILISLIFSFFAIGCFSQNSMLSTLYTNYVQYQNYLTNGSTVKALRSQERLDQGQSLYLGCLAGSLTGRLTIIDSCMTAFDALYGKEHDVPTFTLTAVSYLDLDSLLIDGTKIVNFYPQDSILAWIDEAGIDSMVVINLTTANSIDSTFLNEHLVIFRDSLTHNAAMKDSVLQWIADSVLASAVDSTWESITVDTVKYGNNMQYYTTVNMNFLPSGVVTSDVTMYAVACSGGETNAALKTKLLEFIPTDQYPVVLTEGQMRYDNSENMLKYVNGNGYESTIDTVGGAGGATTCDSSWTSASFDTIIFPDADLQLVSNAQFLFFETLSGIGNVIITPTQVASDRTNGGQIRLSIDASETNPNFIPNRADANTGYSWVSANKAGIVADGQSVATFEYTASHEITDLKDSLIVTGINAVRIDVDSIKTANGYHSYLASTSSVPSDSSIYCITPSGDNFLLPVTSIVDAVQDSAAVSASDKYVKVFDTTGTKFDYFALEPDTVQTITDSTVSVNVTNTRLIVVDDSEGCAIFGFSGGELGDHVSLINVSATNDVILKHNSTGTQKIITGTGSDVTISGPGGAEFWFDGTYWYFTGLVQ